ncbi:hypothetical protein SRABI106_04885 [Rahnella aquatilis]|nr:hypothetical protein SRABI106_04885 [Rahnella aquatilis]
MSLLIVHNGSRHGRTPSAIDPSLAVAGRHRVTGYVAGGSTGLRLSVASCATDKRRIALARSLSLACDPLYFLAGAAFSALLGAARNFAGTHLVPPPFPRPSAVITFMCDDAGLAGFGGGVWHSQCLRKTGLAGANLRLAGHGLPFLALRFTGHFAGARVFQSAAGSAALSAGTGKYRR